jgi:type III restriction enzyme
VESFFERPILNSPYAYPDRHWELDDDGKPTNQILPKRRESKLLTPVPKPQKRRRTANQPGFVFDSGHGLSTEKQEYNPTPIINEIRRYVEDWRKLPKPDQWEDYASVGHTDNADNVRALMPAARGARDAGA